MFDMVYEYWDVWPLKVKVEVKTIYWMFYCFGYIGIRICWIEVVNELSCFADDGDESELKNEV